MKNKHKTNKLLLDIFGWIGLAAILLAFAMVSAGIVDGRSYIFQGLNLTGSIALGAISISKKAYQPAALNAILAVIASVTIITLILS